jgi:hypothetical protein
MDATAEVADDDNNARVTLDRRSSNDPSDHPRQRVRSALRCPAPVRPGPGDIGIPGEAPLRAHRGDQVRLRICLDGSRRVNATAEVAGNDDTVRVTLDWRAAQPSRVTIRASASE